MHQLDKIDRDLIQHILQQSLKERREAAQLTLEQLSTALKVASAELWQAENGEEAVDADLLYLLSEYYRCDVNDFYLGILDAKLPLRSAGSDNAESLLEKTLLTDFQAVEPSELRFAILNMVNGLAAFSRFLDMQGYAFRKI